MSELEVSPIVYEVNFEKDEIESVEDYIKVKDMTYVLDYPTVYIVNDVNKSNEYTVYVGETTNIKRRTIEHIEADIKEREDWHKFVESKKSKMLIIGHKYFNKSLTLDIENRLMQYLSSVEQIKKVNNRRTNQQNKYYTFDMFEKIFSDIWEELRSKNKELFPDKKTVQDSALFKASPFHKLTEEQLKAKNSIILKIEEALTRNQNGQLILVGGEAGSGKTVLMSSLFYELSQLAQTDENFLFKNITYKLLVNHDQQLLVYEQIALKLGIINANNLDAVSKPTRFINNNSPKEKIDVVIVDEAHLLWTQGKQSYRGQNQLQDLLERAKIVVAVFDENQILSREQYWEREEILQMFHDANFERNYIHLENQMRINASATTVKWIRTLIDRKRIGQLPMDEKGYEVRIFDSPKDMQNAIIKKSQSKESSLSRMLATFDWKYIDRKKDEDGNPWYVQVGDWKMPWNLQTNLTRAEKRKNKDLAWAEQAHTINEVGSTFTIQGFDLNYAGVIIGPSVKFRDGEIVFDKNASKNKKAIERRTLDSGEKKDVSEQLLKNELNVLLTRGVNGLYLYAVDPALQQELKRNIFSI